jgi:hypothetical protein
VKVIAHRRNTIAELRATPQDCGVEVDVRSQGSRLVIHHDPFQDGESFDDWIADYRHGTLILNVKEEGLENALQVRMAERGIDDYFFLDQSFPFLLKTVNRGERRCAVRVSEYESLDTALALSGQVEWVWVDSFSRFPLDRERWVALREAAFRMCVVSPELLGRPAEPEIRALRRQFVAWGDEPDAVCTKLAMRSAWTE